MAQEITWSINARVKNGGYDNRFTLSGKTDQAAIGAAEGIVPVGTSESDMPVGNVTQNGVLILSNLDASNYVQYGPKATGAMVVMGRLNAGEVHYLRLDPGVVLRWKANTAIVEVDMHLLQN